MTVLVAADINGLWDWAVLGDAEHERLEIKDAGVNGSVVRLEVGEGVLIGGLQAQLAPHGRGGGWGQVLGHPERRCFISDIIHSIGENSICDRQEVALIALLDELAREARSLWIVVPDSPSFGEDARERLLRIAGRSRSADIRLLWRSIASVLHWLSYLEPASVIHGQTVCVLTLLDDDVQLSSLTLILEGEGSCLDSLVVPERKFSGISLCPGTGVKIIAESIAETLGEDLGVEPSDILSQALAPWRRAAGQPVPNELFRMPDRSWVELRLPNEIALTDLNIDVDPLARSQLEKADVLLLEGPAAENAAWRDAVIVALGIDPNDERLRALSSSAAADGAFKGLKRRIQGVSVYYDYLPQLEINALVNGKPAFVPLIPPGERLEGGERYSASANGNFAIGAGATALTFYLIKEDYPLPKRAKVPLPEPPDCMHVIDVTVEQMPGQGFARIRISSDSFLPFRRAPVELDWLGMEDVQETRESILAELSAHTSTAYPDVVVVPGHAIHWHPEHRRGDLIAMIEAYLAMPVIGSYLNLAALEAVSVLRDRISNPSQPRFEGEQIGITVIEEESRRCLSSNGGMPIPCDGLVVPERGGELVDAMVAKATADLEALVALPEMQNDMAPVRDHVGVLTWTFWRCPRSVVHLLLDIYEGQGNLRLHHTLVGEGLGRTLREAIDIERFFARVEERLTDRGELAMYEYSALGRILGGVDDAALLLSVPTARLFLQAAMQLIDEENDAEYQIAYKRKFKTALLMLAALLRVRRSDPSFIDPVRDSLAESLLEKLSLARHYLSEMEEIFSQRASISHGRERSSDLVVVRRSQRTLPIVKALIDYINLEGHDPNIILKIEDL